MSGFNHPLPQIDTRTTMDGRRLTGAASLGGLPSPTLKQVDQIAYRYDQDALKL